MGSLKRFARLLSDHLVALWGSQVHPLPPAQLTAPSTVDPLALASPPTVALVAPQAQVNLPLQVSLHQLHRWLPAAGSRR